MNPDLPADDGSCAALDEYLDEIDRALEALFVDDTADLVERLRAACDGIGEPSFA